MSVQQNDDLKNESDAIYNPFSGTISVDNSGLNVDIRLIVSSKKFEYNYNYMVINKGGIGALIFMYNYPAFPETEDYEGGSEKFEMKIVQHIPKSIISSCLECWNDKKKVRLMCLNEQELGAFFGLEDYFKRRLEKFGDQLLESSVYEQFIDDWNEEHDYNTVTTKSVLIDGKDKPRITKDDGILNIVKS